MTDLNFTYKEGLEESVIARLADVKALPLDEAMDIYYRSRLATQISEGKLGLEFLSPEYLVDDLIENEPELFSKSSTVYGKENEITAMLI